jgi:hypothetical protein
MFLNDPRFNKNAKLSQNQTAVVEREREQGRDISNLPGVTKKFSHAERISVKQFTIFARAGRIL